MITKQEDKLGKDSRFEHYITFTQLKDLKARKILTRILVGALIAFIIIMLLPWTQNVQSRGNVTALNLSQRPQTIQSVIGGRIEKWYVNEGDFVKKGDTILFLSELKSEYMDPNLVERAGQQIAAKELSAASYGSKSRSLEAQIDNLEQLQTLKQSQSENYLMQARLKIQSDSIALQAAQSAFNIAQKQADRYEQLYKDGLKSLTDVESRRQKLQDATAKIVGAENKLDISRNDLLNAQIELSSIQSQYGEKVAKSRSEKYATLSEQYAAEGEVAKMQTQKSSYEARTGLYYITAPQDGYITKAISSGLGETVKEGEALISIMPAEYELAVELYIDPINIPLIAKDQNIRVVFDGWPNIVFSGWPNSSYGTYGGKVVAIDNFVSANGKYRILVAKDKTEGDWPKELRPSAGAFGIALLNDVPIWYEIWRQVTGFPPDYYHPIEAPKEKK